MVLIALPRALNDLTEGGGLGWRFSGCNVFAVRDGAWGRFCAKIRRKRYPTGAEPSGAPVPTLCIQFQTRRALGLDPGIVEGLMSRLAIAQDAIRRFELQRGRDRGPYINFSFSGSRIALAKVWMDVERRILSGSRFSPKLRASVIVTCEGSRGWDNYLLLWHFNPSVRRDRLSQGRRVAAGQGRRGVVGGRSAR